MSFKIPYFLFLFRKSHFFSRILSPVHPCESDYILIRNTESIFEVIMAEIFFCSGNSDGISHLYFGSVPFSADIIWTVQRPLFWSFLWLWSAWGLAEVSNETWHLSRTFWGVGGFRNLEISFRLLTVVISAGFCGLCCRTNLFWEQKKKQLWGIVLIGFLISPNTRVTNRAWI